MKYLPLDIKLVCNIVIVNQSGTSTVFFQEVEEKHHDTIILKVLDIQLI